MLIWGNSILKVAKERILAYKMLWNKDLCRWTLKIRGDLVLKIEQLLDNKLSGSHFVEFKYPKNVNPFIQSGKV